MKPYLMGGLQQPLLKGPFLLVMARWRLETAIS